MSSIYNHTQKEHTRGRKRRNSEDEEMLDPFNSKYPVRRLSKSGRYNDQKKLKTNIHKRTMRSAILDSMDKEQLITIISTVLNKQPELRQSIMNYIPSPTILSSMEVLVDMEKKFINSYPYNINGPGHDDYTFSRIKESLTDLIDTITQYANHFTSSEVFPTTCFSFLDHATHMAHRLPHWDNDDNNKLKKDLYHDLNSFWKSAIHSTASKLREGECYSPDSVSNWAKSLAQHNSFTGGEYFMEAVHEFTKHLGFMIGLSNELIEPHRETLVCHLPALETGLPSTSVVGDRR